MYICPLSKKKATITGEWLILTILVWFVVISSDSKCIAAGRGSNVFFCNTTPMLVLLMSTPEFTPGITPKFTPFEERKSTPRFDVLLVVVALVVHILWRREL